MIVEAILREVYGRAVVTRGPEAETYEMPENLERFFAAKSAAASPGSAAQPACCSPAEQSSCCGPEDKAECCGTWSGEGCGCR